MSEADGLNITIDADALYREEAYTDRKIGSIRVMIPINKDGSDDTTREKSFVGSAQLMTPMGALPLAFELEANTLEGALDQYEDAAKVALEKTMNELKEMQRQQASSIVTPDSPGGLGGGGIPGGGIQMP
ncbi:hypothetical protein MNBD_GAMMA21-2757 [hydrothermal vent metagenome]|uniref:Cytoplasmic protein n=1 Tax=hydrothermal vent metagenome TaxID=652676 RepID=A0A3B1A0B7_9ZZZZ